MAQFKSLEKIGELQRIFTPDSSGSMTINVTGENVAILAREAQAFTHRRREEILAPPGGAGKPVIEVGDSSPQCVSDNEAPNISDPTCGGES